MFKILITLVLTVVLAGCMTTYKVTRTDPNGTSTHLTVRSFREFPGGINVDYKRDPDSGEFHLEAGEVSNDDQVTQLMLQLLPLLPRVTPAAGQ